MLYIIKTLLFYKVNGLKPGVSLHSEMLRSEMFSVVLCDSQQFTMAIHNWHSHKIAVHTIQWRKNQITNTANLTFTPHLTLKMTTAMVVVVTSVNNNKNSLSQEYTNLDDLHLQTCNYYFILCHSVDTGQWRQ